ncbi:MAG: flagellar hook-associated protein FlgK [bacterium]
MLNISMGLETALRSLLANTAALNTANTNVANANNADYSKQVANMSATSALTIAGQAGQIGTGTLLSSVQRIRDIYLDRQIRTEWMNYGKAEITDRTYQNIMAFIPELSGVPANGIGTKIDQFFTAWTNVSTQAALAAAGSANTLSDALNTVYQLAASLAAQLNTQSNDLTNIQLDLNTELESTVQSVNAQLQNIYQLNKSIVYLMGQGQQPNDLLDKRDAAMAKLAELINFDTANKTDGSVTIMLGGRTLVSGADSYNLLTTMTSGVITKTSPLTFGVRDSRFESVGITNSNGSNAVQLDNSIFTGGKIAGILYSRDNIVHDYSSQLDSVANTLITMVNNIYNATKKSGTTDNVDFFSGTMASNIAVNQTIQSGSDISYTMFKVGDIAKILGQLSNKLVSTRVVSETLSLTSASALSALPLPAGTSGELIINDTHIAVTSTMTMADLINAINTHATDFSAVYNDVTKTFFMVSSKPLVIQEVGLGGNFLRNMKLIEEQISTASIVYNADMASQTLDLNASWISQKYTFDIPATTSGTINISLGGQTYSIDWLNKNSILFTNWSIYALDGNSSVPPGISQYNYFADEKFHFGTRVGNAGVANEITPFTMYDKSGNLTQTMKIIGTVSFNQYYNSISNAIFSDASSAATMVASDKSTLDQLQAMQDTITKVDVNAELAKAKLYQRAYDASVKFMSVIDEMLNMLINKTGTSSTSIS